MRILILLLCLIVSSCFIGQIKFSVKSTGKSGRPYEISTIITIRDRESHTKKTIIIKTNVKAGQILKTKLQHRKIKREIIKGAESDNKRID